MGKLSAKIELAGLDKENNYKSGNSEICNEAVLDLVNQIKSLKIAAAHN